MSKRTLELAMTSGSSVLVQPMGRGRQRMFSFCLIVPVIRHAAPAEAISEEIKLDLSNIFSVSHFCQTVKSDVNKVVIVKQ